MGEKTTKKRQSKNARMHREKRRAWGRSAAFVALLLACVGAMYGMSRSNLNAQTDLARQWHVRGSSVEVAALPLENAFADAASTADETPEKGAITLLPAGTPVAQASEAPADEDNPFATRRPAATEVPPATDMPVAPDAVATVQPDAVPPLESAAPAAFKPVEITITAVGDCTLGGNIPTGGEKRFDRFVENYGYDYFFEKVRPIFEGDDLTIINLEGPLTGSTNMRKGRKFNFRGKPEYVNILTGSSIEICNVANNHALDYGKEGLEETTSLLEEAGIGYSGFDYVYSTEVKGVRVCSLGFTQWDNTKREFVSAIAAARERCDLLIVSMHWGVERQYSPTSQQRDWGRAAVDAGADLVIGNHSHVYGGLEQYNGKYIIYSLGNFCFGGNSNPPDKRCLIFQQTFVWSPQLGLEDGGINVIPASVSGSSSNNDYQPVVLSAGQGGKLLKNVARVSSLKRDLVVWMDDSYVLENGIIETDAPVDTLDGDDVEAANEEEALPLLREDLLA